MSDHPRSCVLMLVAATLTWGQAEAREMATLTVSAPPGAAAALQPVVNAFRSEGGGPVSIVIENEASGSSDVVLATEDVMRGLEQRQWIDPLFVTSFIYGSGKQQHFCGVAAADHSLHKLEAGLFLRFLEAQAPGRIDRFLGGPLGDRSVC